MPPHDLIASMHLHPEIFFPVFLGEPGKLETYWSENMDLYDSLGMPDLEPWSLYTIFFFKTRYPLKVVFFCIGF